MMKRWMFLIIPLAALAAGLLVYGSAFAQQPTPSDDQVNAIARQLYCPVCENVPLDVCPTQACAQWRDLIRQKLAAGWSADQIKNYFVVQYGDRVLATPPRHGLNWLVYVLPPLFILGGAALLFAVLRSMRRSTPGVPSAAPPAASSDDPYVKRLEDELQRREMS
jgi:cytochrome c-type biogenesis protein CcmH